MSLPMGTTGHANRIRFVGELFEVEGTILEEMYLKQSVPRLRLTLDRPVSHI